MSEGGNPFTIRVVSAANGANAGDTAVVTDEGARLVAATLDPAVVPAGPGVLTPVEMIVANLGSLPDTYHLSAALPTGWGGQFALFGQPVSAITVAPGATNAIIVQLLIDQANGAAPGEYPIGVTVQSASAVASGVGVVRVGGMGVGVVITDGPTALTPDGSGVWRVRVTNPGG